MTGQRKRYSAELKAKVALEAIRGQKTPNEIATEYGVHPTHIVQWKKQALEELPQIFSSRREKAEQAEEELKSTLDQEIGQLKVELDWLKKNQERSVEVKRALIEPAHPHISRARQCELLQMARSSSSYEPAQESEEHLHLMRLLDEQYTRTPYVLRGMSIERCNQVWSCDITYIRLQRGFVYLMAIIDCFSRYVLAWEVSITLDTSFCLEALDRALQVATPHIFTRDQGVQFTSAEFTNRLKSAALRISWDGRGRALDNSFVERLGRSVKYADVSIRDYQSVPDAVSNLRASFTFYNQERLHQSLAYQTPAQVYLKQEQAYSRMAEFSLNFGRKLS